MPRWLTWLLCALLASTSLTAHAQTRAWIDRDSVALGETLTLNVETDDSGAGAPDWSPLDGDFIVSGNSSSRQVEIVNRSEEHTSELQSRENLVCRLL